MVRCDLLSLCPQRELFNQGVTGCAYKRIFTGISLVGDKLQIADEENQ